MTFLFIVDGLLVYAEQCSEKDAVRLGTALRKTMPLAKVQIFNVAAEAFLLAQASLANRTPADDDRLFSMVNLSHQCRRCGGTGLYKWGAVVNGIPTHTGRCFDCCGKGYMTAADVKRDIYYHDHAPLLP